MSFSNINFAITHKSQITTQNNIVMVLYICTYIYIYIYTYFYIKFDEGSARNKEE